MGAKRIPSCRERKLAIANDDEPAESGGQEAGSDGRGRQSGEPPEQFGVSRPGKRLNDSALAGSVAASRKADGTFEQGEPGAIASSACGLDHGIQSLQKGLRGRVSPAPPGSSLVLPQEVAHPVSKGVECGASLRAGNCGGIGLQCRPAKR